MDLDCHDLDSFFDNIDEADLFSEFEVNTENTESPCSSSMNLDVPLHEDEYAVYNFEASISINNAYVGQDFATPSILSQESPPSIKPAVIKKPRFRIVYGSLTKSSKKKTKTDTTESFIEDWSKRNCYPKKCIQFPPVSTKQSAFSYPNMVFLALLNAPNNQAYVTDIYDFITYNFPLYSTAPNSWKNCVRSDITKTGMFEKIPTINPDLKIRADMWKVKPGCYEKLLDNLKKTINRVWFDDLKLRKDADLEAILTGYAGMKSSSHTGSL